jgi:hypothetical protein
MPKKSSKASQKARAAARKGAKYTTAFRGYSPDRESAPILPKTAIDAMLGLTGPPKVSAAMLGLTGPPAPDPH